MDRFVGDAAEVLLVVAVGGMLWSAAGRVRRGRVTPVRCPACGALATRAYPRCRECGEPV